MASEQSAALVQPTIKIKSVLLRFVAGFLMVGALSSLGMMFSRIAINIGMLYQMTLVVASIVTDISAFGLWQHKKWAAYLYIGLTVFNQPFLLLMGWWNLGALLIPAILIALIFIKFRSLT
jgi:uncharacterized membrane protein (DUF2068 family)